jgi:predicted ATPase/class 3 adenylate cyclase
MSALPTGTVTFLFTDIEGSTRLVQRLGAAHREVFETHARLLKDSVAREGGAEVAERGDGFFFVFTSASAAVKACATAQRLLDEHLWPPEGKVRVRMGLHTGEGVLAGNNYTGLAVHRAARIADAGHGGQVLLSAAAAALVQDGLPQGLSLRRLGLHRLKDFPQPEGLFQLDINGLQGQFPPPRAEGAASINLPSPLTSFVGRDRELRQVREQMKKTRLLTLTGPGGIGKTRLSLQLAAEVAPAFPDGVFFVPLAQINDPALLVSTILSSMALQPPDGDPRSALHEHLSSRKSLLVLDNFEQLLSAGPQVTDCLQAAPGLKVLVTSRAPLHLYGESEYQVPSMQTPPAGSGKTAVEEAAGSEAVALFVARAAAAKPGFALNEQNAAAVTAITTRLEGLPLAIELAAARVKLLSPEAILARLSSRLTLLIGGARDLPERLQTLRAAIAWSYDLLEPPVQRLFARLAVFHGGACLPELESVCRPAAELGLDTLDGLTKLADHSLLKQAQEGPELRFSMLETIREFASTLLEQSGESELLRERHSQAFAALAETAKPYLTRTQRRAWLDRLETDLYNLRAALARLLESGRAGAAQRLVAALWRFWLMRAHLHEGRERAAEALNLPGGRVPERIAALSAAGAMAYWQTDAPAAGQIFREAVDLARQLGDRRTLALALYDYGFGVLIAGDNARALALVTEGLGIARELGDPAVLAEILCALGTAHWRAGDLEAAEPPLTQALELLAGSDAAYLLSWARGVRGIVRARKGNPAEARADLTAVVNLFADIEDLGMVMQQLVQFAFLSLTEGDTERAFRLLGAALAAQAKSQILLLRIEHLAQGAFEEAAARIGKQRAEELMAEGRLMPARQAMAYALEAPAGAALRS